MSKIYNTQKLICIKRRIKVTDELKQYIFKNINYRRRVWNDFVEEYYRCKERGEEFLPLKYKTKYFNEIEIPNHIYDEYCTGISEQVSKDFKTGLKVRKHTNGKMRFKKFNPFYGTFKVHSKPRYSSVFANVYYCRLQIADDMTVIFRDSKKSYIPIQLNERLFDDVIAIDNEYVFSISKQNYYFRESNIKEIMFLHELGKFYIIICVEGYYIFKKNNKSRIKRAGIDLGIHNPVTIYDSRDKISFIRMTQKQMSRIYYYERRASKLQKIMDNKIVGSKNYRKIQRKFLISHRKARNIRREWRIKSSNFISKMYKTIIVDKSRIPDKTVQDFKTGKVLRKMNYISRFHGMYLFNEYLKHSTVKHNSKYIESPENTTRLCSRCGFMNEHIPLRIRKFKCSNCNYEEDRDVNASRNCYNFEL